MQYPILFPPFFKNLFLFLSAFILDLATLLPLGLTTGCVAFALGHKSVPS